MRVRRLFVLCATVASVACNGAPTAAECAKPATVLVDGLQSYVDGFAKVTPTDLAEKKAASPQLEQLAVAVARYRTEVTKSACDAARLGRSLVNELASLKGEGVIASAIAASLRANLSRASAFGNSAPPPEELRLRPGDDLPSAITGSLPGTKIVLAAGRYNVSEPIVMLDGVTITGAGATRTSIVSSAGGMALLFIGNGTLTLENVAIAHRGTKPASGVFVHAGSYVIRNTRVTGATRGKDGTGGNGLVVGAASEDDKQRTVGRVMRIEDSEFVDNDSSGITIGGNDAPLITGSRVSGSDVCGICYAGTDGGVLRANRIVSNEIGVTVLATAKPVIEGNTFASNRVGLQVRDNARPSITDNALSRNADAAMAFVGKSRGRTARNTCTGGGLGIVLLGSARPTLVANRCSIVNQR